MQFLRTILLKRIGHSSNEQCETDYLTDGASLIYTIPSVTSPLQSLIHSSLGIHSLLKRQPLKHNVIDRDKVLVPPNWDSWGKIRVLREGFDCEAVNIGWSLDIEESGQIDGDTSKTQATLGYSGRPQGTGGALEVYEGTIRDPSLDVLQATNPESNGLKLEVSSLDTQSFLGSQLEVLDRIRAGDSSSATDAARPGTARQHSKSGIDSSENNQADEGRVSEHIGPVQFNMGGIQVDADDVLQRLKVSHFCSFQSPSADLHTQDRQAYQTPEPTTPHVTSPDGKTQNEALASFFAGLMKRGGGSTTSSPKPGAA